MKQMAAMCLCVLLSLSACSSSRVTDDECLSRAESVASGQFATLGAAMNVVAGRAPQADGSVFPSLAAALGTDPHLLRNIFDEAAAKTKTEHGLPPTAEAEIAVWTQELNRDLFEEWRRRDPNSLDAFCELLTPTG